jgi:hypothetical protein
MSLGEKDGSSLRFLGWSGTPVLVHPVAMVEPDASPPAGMRVFTSDKLQELKAAANGFVRALAARNGDHGNVAAVEEQLRHFRLLGADIVATYTLAPRRLAPPR